MGILAGKRPPLSPCILPAATVLVAGFASAEPWTQTVAAFLGRRSPAWVTEDFTTFDAAARLVAAVHGRLLYQPAVLGAVERGTPGTRSAAAARWPTSIRPSSPCWSLRSRASRSGKRSRFGRCWDWRLRE